MTRPEPAIGIIGGTGLYTLSDDYQELTLDTPYGQPSSPVRVTEVAGRPVAFLSRHGSDHSLPPHRINYRANLWAMRAVGVRQLLAPTAVGSLQPALGPGSLVIPDQLVDHTTGRCQTFYHTGAVHVSFADPYCPVGRETILKTAQRTGVPATDGGTLVVVEGPRFSTRAESQWYARQGWSVINMTGHPEAVLARELALCYTATALVTDVDAGAVPGEGVHQGDVFRIFAEHVAKLRELLLVVVSELPDEPGCPCRSTLDGMTLPASLP